MAGTTIETLAVLIEANTKSYENAMKKLLAQTRSTMSESAKETKEMNERLAKLGETAKVVLKQFGLGLGLEGLFKLGETIKEVFASSKELVETADRLGVTTASLQELHYAAQQSGVSVEDFDKALGFFSKTIGGASTGAGEFAAILKLNGVALRDKAGAVRPLNDLMRDYAGLIENAGGSEERAALETVAFGRAGGDLDELFREGAKGIDTLTASADKMGLVIGDDALRRTADLDKEWNNLSITIGTVFKGAVIGAVQAVGDLGTALGNAVLVTGDANDLFNKLSAGKTGVDRGAFVSEHAGINIVNDFAAAGGEGKAVEGPEKKTVLPAAPDAAAAAEKKRYADLAASIATETANLATNSEQQAVNNNVLKLGTNAAPAHIKAITEQTKALFEQQKAIQDNNEAAQFFGQTLYDALDGLALKGDNLTDTLKNIITALAEAALQAELLGSGPLAGVLGTAPKTEGALGGVIGALFSALPKFASGGSLLAGQYGIVGERGPELARGPMAVQPMRSGGGQQVVIVHVDKSRYFDVAVDQRSAAVSQRVTSASLAAVGKAQARRQALA